MNKHFVSVPEPEYEALCAAKDAAEAKVWAQRDSIGKLVRLLRKFHAKQSPYLSARDLTEIRDTLIEATRPQEVGV